ncbi:MAG TPA: YggS family pyridoxal phosphate-dependent enzyme [Pirellulales bacterium]|nr:YggS family pyridoxal phosphate-dependent enzyme [Pirellulales bacterium]
MTRITDNLAEIRQRIAAAAARSGRPAEAVKLVAVTKHVEPSIVRELVAAGCRELGESRPQELWNKARELADLPIHWHMIGHLQRNKVERTLPIVSLIHSVDSRRVVAAIDETAQSLGRTVPILIEVNISGDRSKHGFQADEMAAALPDIIAPGHVRICGLMAMAGREGDAGAARRDFAHLRELRDRMRRSLPDGASLDELSMGMSGDFEAAIEEGATIVRIGSALFEGVAP